MGKYDYEYNFSELLPLGKIASNVAENSVILEFGCYTGGLAKYLKEEKGCQTYAIEIDEEAFEIAKEHLVDGLVGDIEEYQWVSHFENIQFDVLIFADVLEHLHNPGEVLEKACSLLKEDGKILFSIPNIAHNDIILKLLENRFDYTETGLLDSTHIHFWGGDNLKDFFKEHGMFLAELDAHMVEMESTEQSNKRINKNEDVNLRSYLKNRLYGDVYQFVGKAYKLDYASRNRIEFCNKVAPKTNANGVLCKIYYNVGNGFNEEECLNFYREVESDSIDITAHFSEGTTEIRFDPVEGLECILYDVSFRSEFEVLNYEVCNGRNENGTIVFLTTDPQVRVPFMQRDIRKLRITARILYLDSNTSGYVRELLDSVDQSWKLEIQKRKQVEVEKQQLIAFNQEQEKQLKEQYEREIALEKEKKLEMEKQMMEICKESEQKEKNAIFEMQERMHQSELRLEKDNARLEERNSNLGKENSRLEAELSQESRECIVLQKQLQQLEVTSACDKALLEEKNCYLEKENLRLSEQLNKESDEKEKLQEKLQQLEITLNCDKSTLEEKNSYLEKENHSLFERVEEEISEKEALQGEMHRAEMNLECNKIRHEQEKSILELNNKKLLDELVEEKKKAEAAQNIINKANSQIDMMQDLLDKTKVERDALLKIEEEQRLNLESCQKELVDARKHVEQSDYANSQLQLKLTTTEELYKMTQMSLESVKGQKEQLVADYRGLEGLYYAAVEEHNRILNSKSWRYTNTFRVILSKIKNNRFLNYAKNTKNRQAKKKASLSVQPLGESFDASNICFETLVGELTYLSSKRSISIYHIEKLLGYDSACVDNNVVLVSHTLDLTGAPMAVRYFAKKLLNDGYNPVIFSPLGGGLVDTLVQDGIPVVVFEGFIENDFLMKYKDLFAYTVLNTIVCAPLVERLSGLQIPVIWWIHEAEASYHLGQLQVMPRSVGENVKVYCVGEYAKERLLMHFPEYQPEELLYYIPDFYGEKLEARSDYLSNVNGKKIFVSIGSLEDRKGQDILVNAVLSLPEQYLSQCYFVFIGKKHSELMYDSIHYLCEKYPENAIYIPEVSPDEIKSVYRQIDCLVCSSKDDPMPIVVTEAWLMKKAVICSEYTGSAALIEDGVNGFIYRNNDYMELADKIRRLLDMKSDALQIGENARKVYDMYFSKEAFDKNIERIIAPIFDMKCKYDVSVVIPTYNGGEIFRECLELLRQQKNCGLMEIVVVDSGSADGTVELCNENNVKLVQIPNENFSHSYARNLGAEMASGKIIVFMTQDARPSSEFWLSQMIDPIIKDEASAVSCGEQCPEGTDLYYRIASYGHAKYVGFFDRDVVGTIEKCTDDDSLRRNASLNDVACAVSRKVFMRFKHRFNYAEDLDLGIRLLKGGYKIKLLTGTKVIHAHNRSADYYLKRAIVESEAFYKIFPDKKKPSEDVALVVSRMVYSYVAIMEILKRISAMSFKKYATVPEVVTEITHVFDDVLKKTTLPDKIQYSKRFSAPELEKLIEHCLNSFHLYEHPSVFNPVYGVRGYLENSIMSYCEHYQVKYTDKLKNEICDCLFTQFVFSIGAELFPLVDNIKLKEYILNLTKGV